MVKPARTIGLQRATLAGEVRGEIERMIVSGDLAAGEKLNELTLSNAMGVSRGTVREAIRSLADSGLIDLIANRGAFVHKTTLAEARNLYDLRGAIFGMACSAAARRLRDGAEPRLVAQLERNLEQMRAACDHGDTARYYALNIEFHDLLLQASGNTKAKTMYDNLVREMHQFRRKGLSLVTNVAESIQEHEDITKAIAAGDGDAARLRALDHITSGFGRYMNLAEPDPSPKG